MQKERYDIIVVGGGFAGVAAAISAARQHKKVILIEKYNCMGGAAVFDLVNPFMRYWTYSGENRERLELSCGLFSEIMHRIEEAGGLCPDDKRYFNEEILKYVLNHMALESGVQLLYQAYVSGVENDNGHIRSVTVSSVSGSFNLCADYYIDATGDANLAFLAGCPFRLGREADGLCQPMTLCFRLGNVKKSEKNALFARINRLYKQFHAEGKFHNPREDVLIFRTVSENIYHFNTTRVIHLNPTDVYDVTKAEIEARDQIFELYAFLRENFEEFHDSILLTSGMQIGVRESRMIDGAYTLTKEDLLACTQFYDSIAVCNYEIDIHNPDGGGTSHYFFPDGKYYTIPYRCMVPQNADNLLVTGRCVSATHEAQASLRIMPTCCTLGEAAGIATSVAKDTGCAVANADIEKIRSILIRNGAKVN